jgi:hypothetical protein
VESIPAEPTSRPETGPETEPEPGTEAETVVEAASDTPPGPNDLLQRVAGTLADLAEGPVEA